MASPWQLTIKGALGCCDGEDFMLTNALHACNNYCQLKMSQWPYTHSVKSRLKVTVTTKHFHHHVQIVGVYGEHAGYKLTAHITLL